MYHQVQPDFITQVLGVLTHTGWTLIPSLDGLKIPPPDRTKPIMRMHAAVAAVVRGEGDAGLRMIPAPVCVPG